MTHPVVERIAGFVEESGHRTEIVPAHEDGTKFFVRFKSCGEYFQVNVDTNHPTFLYVSAAYGFPNQPTIDESFWRTLFEVQNEVKAVKFSLEGKLLVAAVEQFWDPSTGFEAFFWRCVGAVGYGAQACLRRFEGAETAAIDPSQVHEAAERFIADFIAAPSPEIAPEPEKKTAPKRARRKKEPRER